MSGSTPGGAHGAGQQPQSQPGAGAQPGADPSMEDILASIRRILSEDDAPAVSNPPPSGAAASDPAPTVSAPSAPAPAPSAPAAAPHTTAPLPPDEPEVFTLQESMIVDDARPPQPEPAPMRAAAPPEPVAAPLADRGHLVAPEAEAAAAGSVSALLRAVVAGRDQVHVYRGGPTIEDLVREEIRPLLKAWLDSHLPPMVERLVRTEIERVVGRALP